jgi:hypothetical protein
MARHGSYDHMMAELQLADAHADAHAQGKLSGGRQLSRKSAKPSSSYEDGKQREPRRGSSRSNNSEADDGKADSASSASDQSDDSREGGHPSSCYPAVMRWLPGPDRFLVRSSRP